MPKKVINLLRICLYVFAAYFVIDKFVLTEPSNVIQLESFTKSSKSKYIEVFFKYDNGKWQTLQTYPVSTTKKEFSDSTIWDKNTTLFSDYKNNNYEFIGAYVNDINLDKTSFFYVAERIGNMNENVDNRLKSLTKKSSATLVFKKK